MESAGPCSRSQPSQTRSQEGKSPAQRVGTWLARALVEPYFAFYYSDFALPTVVHRRAPEGRATARAAGAAATALAAAPRYARHAPERTLLYALVQAHYPDFVARLEAEERSLPAYLADFPKRAFELPIRNLLYASDQGNARRRQPQPALMAIVGPADD